MGRYYFGGLLVQRGHRGYGGFDPCGFGFVLFYCGGDYTCAYRFGQDQRVSGLGALVGVDFLGMDQACYRVAELGFFVAYAMSADHCAPGFDHF